MKAMTSLAPLALALAASGCATHTDVPLLFVQTNTAGVSLGTSAAQQGADVVVGYNGSNFAIVPIAAVQNDGTVGQIKAAAGPGHDDALSVFGQFKFSTNTSPKAPKIGLGRFFATGQAARRLSEGYAAMMGDVESVTGASATGDCKNFNVRPPVVRVAQAMGASTAPAAPLAPVATTGTVGENAAEGGLVMLFAEHVSFGFAMTGTATDTAAGVTLGYQDQDVAVVPAISRYKGKASQLLGTTNGVHRDGLSVLGQFDANAKGNDGSTELGLGKFFTTGLAAKRLADGFAASLCQQYVKKS